MTRPKKSLAFDQEKQVLFIKSYSKWANVAEACRAANISRQTFYAHLRDDEKFAAAVASAEQVAIDGLEKKAFSNALYRNSETSLWNLLKAHRPKKYKILDEQRHKVGGDPDNPAPIEVHTFQYGPAVARIANRSILDSHASGPHESDSDGSQVGEDSDGR